MLDLSIEPLCVQKQIKWWQVSFTAASLATSYACVDGQFTYIYIISSIYDTLLQLWQFRTVKNGLKQSVKWHAVNKARQISKLVGAVHSR